MTSILRPAFVVFTALTLVCGIAYPLVVTGIGKAAFPAQAAGSLVAVNGSQGFWDRHEFAVADTPHLIEKLMSYEAEARLMVRRL